MIKALLFIALAFVADYLLVAIAVLISTALIGRASTRMLAKQLGVSFPRMLIIGALHWPWAAWCVLTGGHDERG